ncbi:hypothetical protein [Isoptericola sp. NPDC055881]
MTMPDRLDAARAALASAELRTGVRDGDQRAPRWEAWGPTGRGAGSEEGPGEVPAELFTANLDGGRLPVGAASVVAGSKSLLLALPQRRSTRGTGLRSSACRTWGCSPRRMRGSPSTA